MKLSEPNLVFPLCCRQNVQRLHVELTVKLWAECVSVVFLPFFNIEIIMWHALMTLNKTHHADKTLWWALNLSMAAVCELRAAVWFFTHWSSSSLNRSRWGSWPAGGSKHLWGTDPGMCGSVSVWVHSSVYVECWDDVNKPNLVLPWQRLLLSAVESQYWERNVRTLAQVQVKTVYRNLTKDLKHASCISLTLNLPLSYLVILLLCVF